MPLKVLTLAELVDLLDSVTPDDFLDGLLDESGGEILYAYAEQVIRLSQAAVNTFDGMTPGTAPLGAKATGTMTFSRTGTAAGALYTGTEVWDITGERFLLLADAIWTLGDVADKTVAVKSWARSYQANLLAGTPVFVKTALDVNGDPTLLWDTSVTGVVAALSGGTFPALNTLARARNMDVQFGESAASVRKRLRRLPEKITPPAVEAAAQTGIFEAQLVESFQLAFYADSEDDDGGGFTDGSWDPTDPAPGYRTASLPTGWFVIRIPDQDDLDDWFFTDNPGLDGGYADYETYCPLPLVFIAPWDPAEVYDYGQFGIPSQVAVMAAAVEAAKLGGVWWWIEEIEGV